MQKTNQVSAFFVVGAAKAGTTSLDYYLGQHPEIYMHPYKDVACYFCARYGMPVTLQEFLGFLYPKKAGYKLAGDVCSDYLAEPDSAKEIAQVFPDAKIVIVLRNPADRAFSLYQWMVREGYEYLPTFEAALAAEEDRISRKCKGIDLISPSKQAYLYRHTGYYSDQIKRYLEHFPARNLLVMKYDDLKADPENFVKRIYEFLGVDNAFAPKLKILNRGRWPMFPAFQYYCRRRLTRYLPNRFVAALLRLNKIKNKGLRLDNRTRIDLLKEYANDIREAETLTGLNLASWLEDVEK